MVTQTLTHVISVEIHVEGLAKQISTDFAALPEERFTSSSYLANITRKKGININVKSIKFVLRYDRAKTVRLLLSALLVTVQANAGSEQRRCVQETSTSQALMRPRQIS